MTEPAGAATTTRTVPLASPKLRSAVKPDCSSTVSGHCSSQSVALLGSTKVTNARNASSTASTHPNQHDYDELVTIYSHLDSSTTLAAGTTAAAGASEDTGDPNSWGQLVSQSANGRSSTYERDNSDGSKTVTHVYWTEESADRCPGCDHRYDH